MSADNMIYIQRRGESYWVWMWFASDERVPRPEGSYAKSFDTQKKARDYAFDLHGELVVVEYGVIELDAENEEE